MQYFLKNNLSSPGLKPLPTESCIFFFLTTKMVTLAVINPYDNTMFSANIQAVQTVRCQNCCTFLYFNTYIFTAGFSSVLSCCDVIPSDDSQVKTDPS